MFYIWQDFSLFFFCFFSTWICHLDLSILYLIASYDGRRHLLNPKHLVVLLAGPISRISIQYMDFVEIFNVLLDLFTFNFAHFSWC